LAVKNAEEAAARLGIPFWRHVRHGTAAQDAVARNQDAGRVTS
jgi:hypothetical protein